MNARAVLAAAATPRASIRAALRLCPAMRDLAAGLDDRPVKAYREDQLDEWLAGEPGVALRLLGVGAGDLQIVRQGELFARAPPKETMLDAAIDDIRRRFGAGLVTRASLLPRNGT
jgi:hypothetical protein